jgi:hypothetical protein
MKFNKIALSLLFCGATAFANSVSYSTAGLFTSDSSNTISNSGETITFTGTTGNVGTPTFSSLGSFTTTGSGLGTFNDSFTLTITQTVPSNGIGTASTNISGTISSNSSTILLTFVPSDVVIGTGAGMVSYLFSPDSYGLNNPSVSGGVTTIETYITSTPEPASFGLLGGALLGLGMIARRRAQAK